MSAENNNAMTTITKNPLVIIIVVVIIIGIVLIVKMSGSEEAFSHPSNDEHIVENFPQSTPMNVMYSDSNGNLGTTTDLGLDHLTVKGESSIGGNLTLDGDNKWIFHTPDDGRKTMYVAPVKADKSDWNWGASTQFSNNGDITTGGSVLPNRVVIGGDLSGNRALSVNKATGDWNTQIHNPTSGAHVYMAHGDKYGMHINANNKDLDTYALQCVGGDKQLMLLTGKGNMNVAGDITTGGAVSSNRLVIGGDLSGERAISVNRATTDWNTQIHNPTSGTHVLMAHGGKYGMHINANNKDMDTYALQCVGGDKQLMLLTGKGNMNVAGKITSAGRDILAELDAIKATLNVVKTDPLKCMRKSTYVATGIPPDWGLRHFLDYGSEEGRSKSTINQECANSY